MRVGEAVEVADRGDDGDRGDRVNTGDGHQSVHHGIVESFDREFFGHDGEFLAVEVQLAHGGGDVRSLVSRELPRPAAEAPGRAPSDRSCGWRGELRAQRGRERIDRTGQAS